MSDGALDLNDIQGNVLAGFNTNVEVLVGLTADYARIGEIRVWLASLAPQVSTVADVKKQREAMKGMAGPMGSAAWLCVAIGSDFLPVVRRDLLIREEAFARGYRRRAAGALGDTSDPHTWRVGGVGTGLDVLLIVASNDEVVADARTDDIVRTAEIVGLRTTYRETARRIEDREHFGFRDGISQPKVLGFDEQGSIHPGQFVFGYERVSGGGPFLPAIDPSQFLHNGSLMVFQRLHQDVGAFREFCKAAAGQLSTQWPTLTGPHLEACLVGRWPSGSVASMREEQDPGRPESHNDFDFGTDVDGTECPVGAHIRKVNPRQGPKDVVETPRLLRRGIPFGESYEIGEQSGVERGLAFVAFQTSIENQFEFIIKSWVNSDGRPAPAAGHDLLIGRDPGGPLKVPLKSPYGPVEVSSTSNRWVIPTGGGYLFAPGRSALARMADPEATSGLWLAQKAAARVILRTKQMMNDLRGKAH